MTQENKNLLLKDLCGRLPYDVKCQVQEDEYIYIGTLCRIEVDNKNGHLLDFVETISGLDCQVYLTEVKPYLFPLSSMTEEEKKEFIHYAGYEVEELVNGRHYEFYLKDYIGTPENPICNYNGIDWLNKNHFDYRGLIPIGLAIDATGLNVY